MQNLLIVCRLFPFTFPYMFSFNKNELAFSSLHHRHRAKIYFGENKHVELLLQMKKIVLCKATCGFLFWAAVCKAVVRKSASQHQASWINKIPVVLCKQFLTTQMGK